MKRTKFPLLLLIPSLLIPSCGSRQKEAKYYFIDAPENEKITRSIPYMNTAGKLMSTPFTYSDKYFADANGEKLNVSLAKVALGVSMIASYPELSLNVLNDFGFYDIEDGMANGDGGEKYDRAYYILARKQINSRNMVLIDIRGSDYKEEWVSNFNIGGSGDHTGFSKPAHELVGIAKNYLTKHNIADNPKIWITGYSRAGSIATLLGTYIYNDPFFMMEENDNDLYVNSFEAPKGSVDTNDYPFITNVCNSDDFIADSFHFGMVRPGVDHFVNTYSSREKMEEYWKTIVPNQPLLTFSPKKLTIGGKSLISDDTSSTMTHEEFLQKMIKIVYMDLSDLDNSDGRYVDVSTREKFAENFEFALANMAKIVLLNEQAFTLIADYYKEDLSRAFELTNLLYGTADQMFELFMKLCDIGHIDIKEEDVRKISDQLSPAIKTMMAIAGDDALNMIATVAGNVKLIEFYHRTEVIYSYLETIE